MPRHHLSGSKIELALHCAWWARPDAEHAPRGEPSPEAALGTAIHEAIERFEPGIDPIVGSAFEAWADWWTEWQWNIAGKREMSREVAYALDPLGKRARRLGTTGRDYSGAEDYEIPLTVDMVTTQPTHAVTYEWKTGRPVTPAAKNPQLAGGVLAVALVEPPADQRQGLIAYVRPGEDVFADVATFEPIDLLEWNDRLADLVDEVTAPRRKVEPKPGPHCRSLFCPSFSACPATREALDVVAAPVLAVAKRKLPIVIRSEEIESPEHAAYQYASLRAAKARIDLAWEAVRRWVDEHPEGIPIGGGKVYAKATSKRESIELPDQEAVAVLRRELGEDWTRAVSFETSKVGIERAVRIGAKARGETITAGRERVVEALRKVGAVKEKASVSYDEREAKG